LSGPGLAQRWALASRLRSRRTSRRRSAPLALAARSPTMIASSKTKRGITQLPNIKVSWVAAISSVKLQARSNSPKITAIQI